MRVWLVRHPRVQIETGICYGRQNLPLQPTFEEELERIRAHFPDPPALVWSSPAVHCRFVATELGGTVRVDERLGEMDFGDWEGRRWASIDGPESQAWMRDPWRLRPPGGESGEDMEKRVAAVRAVVLASAVERPVAVVTHDGVMRIWRRLVEKVGREASVEWAIPAGTVWEIE